MQNDSPQSSSQTSLAASASSRQKVSNDSLKSSRSSRRYGLAVGAVCMAFVALVAACSTGSTPDSQSGGSPSAEGAATPSAVTALSGSRSATVSWTSTNPAQSTTYKVTAAGTTSGSGSGATGGQTCTASYGPACVVMGLTPNKAYTFTVTSTTGGKTSPASAPSAAVTIGSCNATYGTVTQPSLLMAVVNTTKYPDDQVYVSVGGVNLNAKLPQWGMAPCDATGGSVPLTSLPKGKSAHTYLFNVGQNIGSGLVWVSLGSPVTSGLPVTQPSPDTSNYRFANVELAYPGQGDTTNVNQFSYPIDLVTYAPKATATELTPDAKTELTSVEADTAPGVTIDDGGSQLADGQSFDPAADPSAASTSSSSTTTAPQTVLVPVAYELYNANTCAVVGSMKSTVDKLNTTYPSPGPVGSTTTTAAPTTTSKTPTSSTSSTSVPPTPNAPVADWSQIQVTDSAGRFVRVVAPMQRTHQPYQGGANPYYQGWPSMMPYINSLKGKSIKVKGLFTPSSDSAYIGQTGWYDYSGTFDKDTGDLTLTGTIQAPLATGPGTKGSVAGSKFSVKALTINTAANDAGFDGLATGIYDQNSQYFVDGVGRNGWTNDKANPAAPNDVYNSIYRDLTSAFSYGYWGGVNGLDNQNFWGSFSPPQAPAGGKPPFAAARTKPDPFVAWNVWSQVMSKFTTAYNTPYGENYGGGAVNRPSPLLTMPNAGELRMIVKDDVDPTSGKCP